MTVGIASENYEFIRRFYECTLKSAESSVEFCGLAVNSEGLRQLYQYRCPDVLVCQWGQSLEPFHQELSIITYFTRTSLNALKLSKIKFPHGEKTAFAEVMALCDGVSRASEHFTGKRNKAVEFRCDAAEVMRRRGIAVNSKGYQYIMDALEILFAEKNRFSDHGGICSAVAKVNNTTVLRVERAMQHAMGGMDMDEFVMEDFLQNIVDAARLVV